MSQDELAKQIGVSRNSISDWENEKGLPETHYIASLAAVLRVTADELLTRAAPPTSLRHVDPGIYGHGREGPHLEEILAGNEAAASFDDLSRALVLLNREVKDLKSGLVAAGSGPSPRASQS